VPLEALIFLVLSQQLLEFGLDISQIGLILEFRSPLLKLYKCFHNSDSCERVLFGAALSDKKIDNMLLGEVPFRAFWNFVELSQLVVPNLRPIAAICLLAGRKHTSTYTKDYTDFKHTVT
jgi:hypothetical protein